MKFSSLNCKIESFSQTENPNLLKVKIKVMHDGENKNGTKFSLDSIKVAEETIKNTPILAYILDDGSDFDEHNMKLKKEDGEYKLVYVEKPIGVIPTDTEITYETDDEGKTYFTVTGYVWARYSNEGYDIIQNSESKGVSMEIEILDGEMDEKDNLYDIKEFNFLGVTVLGDHVEPAMYDTKLEKYSLSKSYKKELESIYKEIYSLNSKEGEVKIVGNNVKTTVENTENKIVGTIENAKFKSTLIHTKENTSAEIKEKTDVSFSLSVDDMYSLIQNKLKDMKVECVDYWGEKYLDQKYWICTILPFDKMVVLNENGDYYNYYGVPFEIKGDDIELNFDNKTPYIKEWRPKKDDETLVEFKKDDTLKEIIINKFNKKDDEIKKLNKELETLKDFKVEKDKEELTEKVEQVVKGFSTLEEDEIEDLKIKALEGELGLDEFKKELFCLVGMKSLKTKENFSLEKDKVTHAKVMDIEVFSKDEQKDKPYGGLFERYGINY